MTPERFERGYMGEPNSGCWLWMGHLSDGGYGSASWKGRSTGAHRVSWMLHRGEIPSGLWVLHKCDVAACLVGVETLSARAEAAEARAETARAEALEDLRKLDDVVAYLQIEDDFITPVEAIADLRNQIFGVIAHGDEQHRAWLKQALDDFFLKDRRGLAELTAPPPTAGQREEANG